MVGLILVILGICFIAFILLLIDGIIEKYFCGIIKYRIVKITKDSSTKYIIQRRLLWFFWKYVCGYSARLYSLEEVKSQIERFKCKKQSKKEVVYEE